MNAPTRSNKPETAASRVPRWIVGLVLLSALAIAWGIWSAVKNRTQQSQTLAKSAAQPDTVMQIAAQDWQTLSPVTLQLGIPITGTVTAQAQAWVKARVAGELRDLQVREGDSVMQGQTIARVDAADITARVRQAEQQAQAMQAQVNIAQRQHNNDQTLAAQGFISATALAASAANLQATQAQWAAARAAQDAVQQNLNDTVLRSPIAGQVSQRLAHNGERVVPEARIVEIVNLQSLELQAQISANDSAQVQVGQSAQLQLSTSQGVADAQWTAQVVRINPSADNASRAVGVYLALPTPPSAANVPNGAPTSVQLRPGMYLQGMVHTGTAHTLALPLSAVRTDKPMPYVQIVRNGLVLHAPVQLGAQAIYQGQSWAAVSGVQAGDAALLSTLGAVPEHTQVKLMPATNDRLQTGASAQTGS